MRPLVTWSVLVAAGIALQGRLGFAPAVWTGLAAALGLLVALGTARGRRMAPLALALVVVTSAGWLAQHEARLEAGLSPFIDGSPVVLRGQVVTYPEADGARLHLVVRVDRVERGAETVVAAGRVRVTMPATVEVDYGDRVQMRAVLRRPASAGNPGAFDYRDHLRRQGITAIATVSYPRHVSVIARRQLNPFLRLAAGVRARVAEGLRATLTPERAGVMTGLVFGERQDLSPELEDAFRRAGVTHLLAVSGLHVGFVATTGWRLLRALRVPRAASALAGAALVWLYVLATGARPPAVRAGVGTTLGLLASAVGRERDLASALALAALVLMLQNPLVLFDVSFQLTFAATAGILLAYGPLCQAMAKLPRALAGAVAVTAGAQLGVTPLLAYYFQEVSLVGFAASLIGAPLTGALVPLGLAAGLLFHVWPGGTQLLAAVVNWGLEALLAATAGFARLPWAVVSVPKPASWAIAVWWVLAAVALRWSELAPRWRRGLLWACTLIVAATWSAAALVPRPLEMLVLDVGQGDAILIRTPAGVTALVDGGGRRVLEGNEVFNAGKDVVLPFLRREGVRRVDVVVVTHPHDDHLAGLLPVLSGVPVGLVVDNGHGGSTPLWDEYLAIIRERGLARRIVQAGQSIVLDGQTVLEVLHPPSVPLAGAGDGLNDNSIVLRLRYGRTAVLLTGDLDVAGQEHLLKIGADLRADVVKVPHHGSRLSLVSEFYAATGAAAAVISVGANTYGQPHPDVLAVLEQLGISIYRTDVHGALRWESDGTAWRLCPTRVLQPEEAYAC